MADLCKNCESCIGCDTWGEKKCLKLKTRIYSEITNCKHYKKRDKNFKESKCKCDDCLSRGEEE